MRLTLSVYSHYSPILPFYFYDIIEYINNFLSGWTKLTIKVFQVNIIIDEKVTKKIRITTITKDDYNKATKITKTIIPKQRRKNNTRMLYFFRHYLSKLA